MVQSNSIPAPVQTRLTFFSSYKFAKLAPNIPAFSHSFFGFLVFYFAMAYTYFLLLDVFCAITALVIIRRILQPRLYAPLPPGPAGLPLVGNILDMPADNEWLTFAKWGELYGQDWFGFSASGAHTNTLQAIFLPSPSLARQ